MSIFQNALLAVLVLILPLSASGYILSADFIIKMMLKANGAIQDARVEGTTTILLTDSAYENYQTSEILYLKFPDSYRLDITLPYEKKTIVYNSGDTWTIMGGRIISHAGDRRTVFQDLLIRRSVDEIVRLFHSWNIDTEVVGMGRFNGKIAYIIGAKEVDVGYSQLWAEKGTFLPLRFITEEEKEDSIMTIEVRYLDYQHIDGKFWYPSTIEYYYDDELASRYQTEKILVNTSIHDSLFDISKLTRDNL